MTIERKHLGGQELSDLETTFKHWVLIKKNMPIKAVRKVLSENSLNISKVNKRAKIRNRYNQVPHLTQDTNGKVTNSQLDTKTRAKRSAFSQQVTTKHIKQSHTKA